MTLTLPHPDALVLTLPPPAPTVIPEGMLCINCFCVRQHAADCGAALVVSDVKEDTR